MRPRACLGCDTVTREDEPCASVLGGSSDGRSALVHADCFVAGMKKVVSGIECPPDVLLAVRENLQLPAWYDRMHDAVDGLNQRFPQPAPFAELPPGFDKKP